MLCLLFLSCLPFFGGVFGKTERDTNNIVHVILREQASMIKHCMSNVCTRNMYNPNKPVKQKQMVAFHVFPKRVKQNIKAHSKIIFDGVVTNIGHAYNSNTGVFTAPEDGVYVFTGSIMTKRGSYTAVYMQVNGTKHLKALIQCDATNYGAPWFSTSQSFVTDLKKGDEVSLVKDRVTGGDIRQYSTFTGYRIM